MKTGVVVGDEIVLTREMKSLKSHSPLLTPTNNLQGEVAQYNRVRAATFVNVSDTSGIV